MKTSYILLTALILIITLTSCDRIGSETDLNMLDVELIPILQSDLAFDLPASSQLIAGYEIKLPFEISNENHQIKLHYQMHILGIEPGTIISRSNGSMTINSEHKIENYFLFLEQPTDNGLKHIFGTFSEKGWSSGTMDLSNQIAIDSHVQKRATPSKVKLGQSISVVAFAEQDLMLFDDVQEFLVDQNRVNLEGDSVLYVNIWISARRGSDHKENPLALQ